MEEAILEENVLEEEDDQKKKVNKLYCANCLHCILVKQSADGREGQFLLRVKCSKGKWRKKLGDEKLYKYFSVNRRVVEECDSYEEMGELKSFLRDLKKNLPQSDEVYRSL